MSEEEAHREAAILAYEAEGNRKVQANMRRMQEQGVIKVARPSRVVTTASAAVVASSRRLSLRSSARAPSSPASNADASCAPWSWENDEASNDSFSDPAAERSSRGDSPAGPAFVKIILPGHVGPEGRLPAPAGLADFLPPTARSLALVCDGESWRCTWSVGRDAADASLAGNWRGFAEDQRLEPGDAVTLKKEAGATLRVTIHRARSFVATNATDDTTPSHPKSLLFGAGVGHVGAQKRAHAKTNDASRGGFCFRERNDAWTAAFAEAAALTDALFANHGAKPGAAVVDAGVAAACPGGGTDPATHAHSRRTRAMERRWKSAAPRDASGREATATPRAPARARAGKDDGVTDKIDKATPHDVALGDVQNAGGVAAFASPRPAETTRARDVSESDRARRFVAADAVDPENDDFLWKSSFFVGSPEATPAPPSTGARACAAARAAREAGVRAPLRAGETRRRGSSPRNPMETPATPTSARRAFRDVVSAGPGPGPGPGTCVGTVPAESPFSRRAAWEDERVVAATGRRTEGEKATRRLTSRFVSSATLGAAPMEGGEITPRGFGPGRCARNERRDENKSALTKKNPKPVTTKLDAFASTPEGTPLSQVFKATKSFGGSSAAARHAQAFVTPVEKAFSRSDTKAESPGFEDIVARAKRRRA